MEWKGNSINKVLLSLCPLLLSIIKKLAKKIKIKDKCQYGCTHCHTGWCHRRSSLVLTFTSFLIYKYTQERRPLYNFDLTLRLETTKGSKGTEIMINRLYLAIFTLLLLIAASFLHSATADSGTEIPPINDPNNRSKSNIMYMPDFFRHFVLGPKYSSCKEQRILFFLGRSTPNIICYCTQFVFPFLFWHIVCALFSVCVDLFNFQEILWYIFPIFFLAFFKGF